MGSMLPYIYIYIAYMDPMGYDDLGMIYGIVLTALNKKCIVRCELIFWKLP